MIILWNLSTFGEIDTKILQEILLEKPKDLWKHLKCTEKPKISSSTLSQAYWNLVSFHESL
jgi:hypothetical protein